MKTTAFRPLPLLCLLLSLVAAGCGQEDVARVREHAALSDAPAPAEGEFSAELVLCRRVGSKTGKRIAVGDDFVERPEKKNRYIHAFLDVHDAPAGEHQVHLVWIKPGGKEMFRKSAEVRVAPGEEGWDVDVLWYDAEDLHDREADPTVSSPTPDLTLYTRLNVSPKRERQEGEYAVRAYWNRELLIEKSFRFGRSES